MYQIGEINSIRVLAETQSTTDANVLTAILRAWQQQRWIPVAERLPNPGVPVLISCTGEDDVPRVMEAMRDRSEPCWRLFDMGKIDGVTHWMPLPAPPAESQQEQP